MGNKRERVKNLCDYCGGYSYTRDAALYGDTIPESTVVDVHITDSESGKITKICLRCIVKIFDKVLKND